MSNTPPQSPRSPSELKFTPQPMVGWFNPRQLLSTGVQALLSEVIGSYADKRELQAALRGNPGPHTEYASHDEIWIDFVADLGDGFDSTYTVACLLAQPTLTADGTEDTPRGRVLIMGGDQVYPSPAEPNTRTGCMGRTKRRFRTCLTSGRTCSRSPAITIGTTA